MGTSELGESLGKNRAKSKWQEPQGFRCFCQERPAPQVPVHRPVPSRRSQVLLGTSEHRVPHLFASRKGWPQTQLYSLNGELNSAADSRHPPAETFVRDGTALPDFSCPLDPRYRQCLCVLGLFSETGEGDCGDVWRCGDERAPEDCVPDLNRLQAARFFP